MTEKTIFTASAAPPGQKQMEWPTLSSAKKNKINSGTIEDLLGPPVNKEPVPEQFGPSPAYEPGGGGHGSPAPAVGGAVEQRWQ